MSPETKAKVLDYLRSSAVTFLTMFVLVLAPHLQGTNFNDLEAAGCTGALVVIARLGVRAAWEAFVVAFASLAERIKNR